MNTKQHPKKRLFTFNRKITSFEKVIFTRHLSTLISAGIPLIHAIDHIAQGHHHLEMKKSLFALKKSLSEGHSFADSLKKSPKIFDPFFCQLVQAAELSGTLEIMLKKIILNLEQSESLKKKIKKALVYPITIICMGFVVSIYLLLFIAPQFEALFKSFNAEPPLFTRSIILVSTLIQKNLMIMLILSVFFMLSIKLTFDRFRIFKDLIDKYLLKLPIIGRLIENTILAKLSGTLSILLTAGTPLLEALHSTANTVRNRDFQNALIKIRVQIMNGQSLHQSLSETALFPDIFKQMIAAGERSSSLPILLEKLAAYYEEEFDQMISQLSQAMEPIMMLILGLIIGSFVIAMYMPIFKLGTLF